jgi:hypothetical protein
MQQVVNLDGTSADPGRFGETLDLMVPDAVVSVSDLDKQEVCVHVGSSKFASLALYQRTGWLAGLPRWQRLMGVVMLVRA